MLCPLLQVEIPPNIYDFISSAIDLHLSSACDPPKPHLQFLAASTSKQWSELSFPIADSTDHTSPRSPFDNDGLSSSSSKPHSTQFSTAKEPNFLLLVKVFCMRCLFQEILPERIYLALFSKTSAERLHVTRFRRRSYAQPVSWPLSLPVYFSWVFVFIVYNTVRRKPFEGLLQRTFLLLSTGDQSCHEKRLNLRRQVNGSLEACCCCQAERDIPNQISDPFGDLFMGSKEKRRPSLNLSWINMGF